MQCLINDYCLDILRVSRTVLSWPIRGLANRELANQSPESDSQHPQSANSKKLPSATDTNVFWAKIFLYNVSQGNISNLNKLLLQFSNYTEKLRCILIRLCRDLLKYWRAKYFRGYKEIIGISQDETFILLGIKFILQINPFILSQRIQIKFFNSTQVQG